VRSLRFFEARIDALLPNRGRRRLADEQHWICNLIETPAVVGGGSDAAADRRQQRGRRVGAWQIMRDLDMLAR
jgi:hypothetical protein